MKHFPQAKHYQTTEPVTFDVSGGHIQRVDTGQIEDTDSLLYAPVFVDLQINGYQGVNFTASSDLTKDAVYQVMQRLWSHGVAYFLPTITTSSFENIKKCFEILSASRQEAAVARSVPGYHLEGPYISSIDGPRGMHPIEHARPPSWDQFMGWQDAAEGMIKLVTLAPELPGAISFIEKLRAENIIPAIGHTNAQAEDIEQAVAAGAVLSTHLGNGSQRGDSQTP